MAKETLPARDDRPRRTPPSDTTAAHDATNAMPLDDDLMLPNHDQANAPDEIEEYHFNHMPLPDAPPEEDDQLITSALAPSSVQPQTSPVYTPPVYVPQLTFRERLAQVTWEQWTFGAIFLLGAVIRLWGLADKPLHHDESLHAYFALQFLNNPSSYLYDPLLHGPFQFHLIPIFYVIGHMLGLSDGGANDFTVRLLPAVMGMAMVAMPYWLRDHLGRFGALAVAFLLAVTPSFVYFSRFVRDDIYVTCFTLLIIVGAVQYYRTRRLSWLLTIVAALTLSYTAMENTFFIIAIFGSFLLAVTLWDLGPAVGRRLGTRFLERDQPLAGRIILLAPFLVVMGAAALLGLHQLGVLSTTINTLAAQHSGANDPLNPDNAIKLIEQNAVGILLIGSILVSLAVIVGILFQGGLFGAEPDANARPFGSVRFRRTDPRTQPVLNTLASTHWIRWFICFVVAWVLFAAFFWQLPAHPVPANLFNGAQWQASLKEWGTGFQNGIGRGLVQGIYYWLEQQHVARGGQPWYYYLIVIPLYEPLVVVFGLGGLVRALLQPTRFRIFLVYWFATTLLLYSWAGEKMPWLTIHIVLPLIALAGVALDWVIGTLVRGARSWWQPTRALVALGGVMLAVAIAATSVATTVGVTLMLSLAAIVLLGAAAIVEQWAHRRQVQHVLADAPSLAPHWLMGTRQITAAGCLALAFFLLIPTLWNTQRLVYFEPSVAPNEMLIYVQTTTDVQRVMDKIATLDQKLYGGTHQLHIGVTPAAVWPFAWYLHSYPNTLYSYTASKEGTQPEVIIADEEGGAANTVATVGDQFATTSLPYHLRWWWDESYKLPPCSGTKTSQCTQQATWGTGVGPFLWITYGAYPPATCQDLTKAKCDPLNDPFNGALAAQRYWNWLWQRQNISGTTPGSTDFAFYVRNDLLGIEKP